VLFTQLSSYTVIHFLLYVSVVHLYIITYHVILMIIEKHIFGHTYEIKKKKTRLYES